ncbi:hypothetical protein K491DRAFT_755999 [Lophiostoma macrostomum CBS 122681]|uniref:Actin-like ATPase domain-containing protein n=1 Tax=Lophiostoma macrostomum CBS 122681 TaxID=1314788 RepID=A0A6A6TG52_9PLEO|nr:hypothetical protein K491DRAFT_755999 [Lophiostoma macrostomum CBS 122681]
MVREIQRRLVIGVDYGTTYTDVSFATPLGDTCSLDEIDVNSEWDPGMSNEPKVPSVISYPEQEWGDKVGANSIVMVHTKLELDVGEVDDELDLLLQTLDGMKDLSFRHLRATEMMGGRPAYTQKSSEEIVTDYLSKILQCIIPQIDAKISQELRHIIPTDIVITVPTKWSYRAMNSTYRASTKAGFNHHYFPMLKEVIFVTESEAAAIYTTRYLKNRQGTEFLRMNEPFILCDAGGGTVDVVSYKVTQLSPTLQIEQICKPTGRKCGSVFINLAFKKWLRMLIGEQNYRELDPELGETKISSHSAEGPAMRELMRDFNARKEIFHSHYGEDIRIDLPAPKDNLTLPGKVNAGQIRISSRQMEVFFDGCVGQIINLLREHKEAIQKSGTGVRLRNVILVGGFGESKYLQEQITEHLGLTDINLRQPDTSWTAVVQGAVVCGIEKNRSENLIRANYCRHHYGILSKQIFSAAYHTEADRLRYDKSGIGLADGQLLWFFTKGDLIASNSPLSVTETISLHFSTSEPKKKALQFFRYSEDDRPTRFKEAQNGSYSSQSTHGYTSLLTLAIELDAVCTLEVDLSDFPDSAFTLGQRPGMIQVEVAVKMRLVGDSLSASVASKSGRWLNKPRILCQQSNIPY